jgi:molecular chaperone DnaK (HSP70)
LPISAKRVFKTQKADQRSVLVQIVEGESVSAEDCVQLGKCTVRDLPPGLPDQTPIEVRFRYLENGRLTVMVKVLGTDRWVQRELTRENTLSQEKLDTWRHFVSGVLPPVRQGDSGNEDRSDG